MCNMGVSRVMVLLLIFLAGVYTQNPYKICSKRKDAQDCDQIGRRNIVNCVPQLHGIDCLLDLEGKEADFGFVTPEEALIAANFLDNVVVLGEFRNDAVNDSFELATVVIVKKGHTEGLKGFKGKKYCHPGFKFNRISTDYMLKEFENTVLKENNAEGCQNSGILLEKELKALTDFFGPTCRPGPWVGFDEYDSKFFTKYSKLCELCSGNDKCVAGNEPFMDSLNCLINGGDVAVTTINTVYEFFNKTENQNKIDEYRYVCKNGELNNLNNPCTWSKQPWNLIVANKQKEGVKTDLQAWFSSDVLNKDPNVEPGSDNMYYDYIKQILFPEAKEYNKIEIVDGAPSLKDYLKRYREIPNINEKCNENIRWCTISDAEQQKCNWLAQANANLALQPTVRCVQSDNTFECLEDIKSSKADVVTSDGHYGYIARRKNLVPVAFPDTASDYAIKPIIVIRHNSSITKLDDLKNKRACLPEYGGIEWLSFITIARTQEVLSKSSCDYGKLISDFVGESCMPGAHDKEHEVTKSIDHNKLCALCQPAPGGRTAVNCNSNSENKFYGNSGALKCLQEVGDFAVVTREDYSEFNSSEFRVLCKNGSLASTPGFNIDDHCALTKIIDSEVISKKDSAKVENIGVVLLNLERRFGLDRHKPFEVFNTFNKTVDLLFQDTTQGLSQVNSAKSSIQNFKNLFIDIEKCVESNDNNGAEPLKITLLPLVVGVLLINTLQRIY